MLIGFFFKKNRFSVRFVSFVWKKRIVSVPFSEDHSDFLFEI